MAGPKLTDDDIRSALIAMDVHVASVRGELMMLRLVMENSMADSLIATSDDPLASADEYFAGLEKQAGKTTLSGQPNPQATSALYAADDALDRLHRAVVARIKGHLK